jgi:hypothetical protein
MPDEQIIAEYHEHIRGLLDRRLSLYAHCVKVVGIVRGNRWEGEVALTSLQASPHRTWLRSKHFHWATACLFILTPFLFLPFVVWPPNLVLLSIGAFLYVPAIWYFKISRTRNEYALFLNHSGVVSLDFGCTGPDASRFPEFVAAISKQISEQSVEPKLPTTVSHHPS